MKHKQFGFLHLMCGKQGEKGKRKLSVELSYQNTPSVYLFGFSIRLIFFFVSIIIEIEKKQEMDYGKYVSQETANDDSVQGP
jgi:hypothetical protein